MYSKLVTRILITISTTFQWCLLCEHAIERVDQRPYVWKK